MESAEPLGPRVGTLPTIFSCADADALAVWSRPSWTRRRCLIAVEADLTQLEEAKRRGHKVIFGDASRRSILDAAGLTRARLLVVTFDRRPQVERLLHHARDANPSVPSIVSAADNRNISALVTAGCRVVFPEDLAVGLALAHQALLLSDFTREEAARLIAAIRAALNPE